MEENNIPGTIEYTGSDEEMISFNKIKDLQRVGVQNYTTDELMAVISGYQLEFNFNMELINGVKDAEAVANALADAFYDIIMDKLIKRKPELIPDVPDSTVNNH